MPDNIYLDEILSRFEAEDDIYPLQVIPTGIQTYLDNTKDTVEFSGIHFADTSRILSIQHDYSPYLDWSLGSGKSFRSMEIGEWCRRLAMSGDIEAIEHLKIEPLTTNIDLEIFKELGEETLSLQTAIWLSNQAHDAARGALLPGISIDIRSHNSFWGFYSVFTGMQFCREEVFFSYFKDLNLEDIVEADRKMFNKICHALQTNTDFPSRRDFAEIGFVLDTLASELDEDISESEIQEKPEKELIQKLDDTLMQLRKALL